MLGTGSLTIYSDDPNFRGIFTIIITCKDTYTATKKSINFPLKIMHLCQGSEITPFKFFIENIRLDGTV